MKLKYYLRGLGIGVVVTTIILAIALEKNPVALTDAQIKERAAELGMVEEGRVKQENKSEDTTATKPTTKPTITTTHAAEPTTTTTKAQETAEKASEGAYIEVEIGTYDWSNHVAEKFVELGLVKDAKDFDQYLIDHGYETKIRSGKHKFRMGASYEELAKELINLPK